MSKISEFKNKIAEENDGYLPGHYSKIDKSKVIEMIEELRPEIKTDRDKLLIEYAETSVGLIDILIDAEIERLRLDISARLPNLSAEAIKEIIDETKSNLCDALGLDERLTEIYKQIKEI